MISDEKHNLLEVALFDQVLVIFDARVSVIGCLAAGGINRIRPNRVRSERGLIVVTTLRSLHQRPSLSLPVFNNRNENRLIDSAKQINKKLII